MKLQRHNLLLSTTLILFCLGLCLFVIWPTMARLQKDKMEIYAEKQNLKELLEKGNSIEQNRRNLDKVLTEKSRIDMVFLQVGQELNFITDLESKAKENAVSQIIDFNNDDFLETKETVKIVPLHLEIKGSLQNILTYINALEKLNYYININKINLGRNTNIKNTQKQFSNQINSEIDNGENIETTTIEIAASIDAVTYWR